MLRQVLLYCASSLSTRTANLSHSATHINRPSEAIWPFTVSSLQTCSFVTYPRHTT